MSDYQLILGDCLDKMSQVEDGSIDMICADLPYGTTACKWDVIIPFEPLWAHYKRVIKRNGAIVLFAASTFNYILYNSNPDLFRYEWVWDKKFGGNFQLSKYQPLRIHEYIMVFSFGTCVFVKNNTTMNYHPQMEKRATILDTRNWKLNHKEKKGEVNHIRNHNPQTVKKVYAHKFPSSIIECHISQNETNNTKRLHPTQKPVTLLSYLIRTYTNPGETVLDNVFGSCSTGEACLREGRRFIGIEKDESYYQIGVDRMARIAAELRGEFVPRPAKKPVEDLPMFAGATL